mmetsp:Transcript_36183/g.71146  ORF Transcript_36183/g.71146 Transcript_36183/m.71146 type:complete len:566 (+) Transcript_36183:27-1724(+)|eukprot:CAMPEP_0175141690 /NCGR_PEP_ID=MMETSP0087-20121206/12291_1 /TAXON_ID=136419 /ORGANISM="Unknown Unknown, Strain D1" /LENGTH=565 /DNA_ID=CAMNT_0016425225 /DNA_START=27 /DNA_END=1724 /DNA_ORIENTATION=-
MRKFSTWISVLSWLGLALGKDVSKKQEHPYPEPRPEIPYDKRVFLPNAYSFIREDPEGAFREWLGLNGVDLSRVQFKHGEGRGTDPVGFSLFTSKRATPADAVLSVPMHLALSLEAAQLDPVYSEVLKLPVFNRQNVTTPILTPGAPASTQGSVQVDLISFVMYERAKGYKSFWAPYFAMLDKARVSTLLDWTEEELQELQSLKSFPQVEDAKRKLQYIFHDLFKGLREHDTLSAEFSKPDYSEAAMLWATQVVQTRAFGSPVGAALYPLADLINHSPPNEAFHSYDSREPVAMASFTQDDLGNMQMRPDFTVKAGKELFITYAPTRTNMELLFGYGFAIEHNPYEKANIEVQGLKENVDFTVSELSPVFMAFLRASVFAQKKKKLLTPKQSSSVWLLRSKFRRPLDGWNEINSLRNGLNLLEQMDSHWPTQTDADKSMFAECEADGVDATGCDDKLHTALIFRLTVKRILWGQSVYMMNMLKDVTKIVDETQKDNEAFLEEMQELEEENANVKAKKRARELQFLKQTISEMGQEDQPLTEEEEGGGKGGGEGGDSNAAKPKQEL